MTEETIEHKLNRETARIHWHELQTYFASGNVINVASELDLITVAKEISQDNTVKVKSWMEKNLVGNVSDEQAKKWHQANIELWAVVIKPLILVQETNT